VSIKTNLRTLTAKITTVKTVLADMDIDDLAEADLDYSHAEALGLVEDLEAVLKEMYRSA